MHVAVIGLGNFGASLVRGLHEHGHQVTAVDRSEKSVSQIQDLAEVAAVLDATDRGALEELGVPLADAAVVSLGGDMASSILVTLHLKELKLGRIVAKAISPEHEKILSRVGATDVVFPERDAALRLANTLPNPNLLDYVPLSPEFSVAEVSPPQALVGKTLVELDLRRRHQVSVIAVREMGRKQFSLVVRPDYTIRDSDILVVAGRQEDIEKLNKDK